MSINNLFSLDGKGAFVTGGSRGLGFAMACALAEAGAKIYFCARSEESVEKGLDAYKAKGIDAKGYVCDVTCAPAVWWLFSEIENNTGSIDILLNNAGIINRVPMTDMEAMDFRRVVDTDLVGPLIMSEVGRETAAAYASAKGGLKMLTKNIASEYGSRNIQCNAVAPGYMATDMNAAMRAKQPDGSPNPFDSFICAQTPAGRWGIPEKDLAGPVVFLASEASGFVNGQMLYVDGGFLSYLGRNN